MLVPINLKDPDTTKPPFQVDDREDLIFCHYRGGWAMFWVLAHGRMEFGTSLTWATQSCQQITKAVNAAGYQTGEYLAVCFDLDPNDQYPDIDLLVERYDWSTGVKAP